MLGTWGIIIMFDDLRCIGRMVGCVDLPPPELTPGLSSALLLNCPQTLPVCETRRLDPADLYWAAPLYHELTVPGSILNTSSSQTRPTVRWTHRRQSSLTCQQKLQRITPDPATSEWSVGTPDPSAAGCFSQNLAGVGTAMWLYQRHAEYQLPAFLLQGNKLLLS